MLSAYGKPRWWSDDPFTVMFQSVLVQSTVWGSGEKTCAVIGDKLTPEYGLQGRYGRGIVAVEKVCDGGLGKAGFFAKPVVCPSPFIHKVFYMLYYIYAISICIYFKEREAVGGGV